MIMHRLLFAGVVVCAAACATIEDDGGAASQDLDAEVAAKQGETVQRICFTQNISEWRPLGARALLLREGVDEWYYVTLAGVCDARRAQRAIGLDVGPGGGACLERGDRIAVFDRPTSGSCRVLDIHEWNDDAEPAA